MNDRSRKFEDLIVAIAEAASIGQPNDALTKIIKEARGLAEDELTEDDLDLVRAARSAPDYNRFLQFVREKEGK